MIHIEYDEKKRILYGVIAIHVAEINATQGDLIELNAVVDNKIKMMRKSVMEKIDEQAVID